MPHNGNTTRRVPCCQEGGRGLQRPLDACVRSHVLVYAPFLASIGSLLPVMRRRAHCIDVGATNGRMVPRETDRNARAEARHYGNR
jgi:hypothetical protein